MRKNVRVQILGLFPDILDGIKYAQTANKVSALGVLENCCAALKSIGNALKDGLSESRFLAYNKIINQLFLLLTEMKLSLSVSKNKQHIAAEIQKTMDRMITELQQEKEVDREILFLPYKASMWDSLESIWSAAKDDPHCECVVMPIPYFDKKMDKSFGEMHYEGERFPSYVPITRYSEYAISQRRPDVIYIHNPYDGYNYVTAVHPKYYSQELKKYTDMLVYVPYFLIGGLWPEAHIDKSCYYFMDKMIVQKDRIETQPMQEENPANLDKKYLNDYVPEEKLVPLGSPKIDRVLFCEKHKEIPVEWQDRICGKKVVLYNVSLTLILNNGENVLRKMQYIFNCFRGRQDVVLLFRPHPLLESTLKLMSPQLYGMYKDVEKKFLSENIGILDKTQDIDMAVAIADAYIGESSSSVVCLFGVAGKPIFFTNEVRLWKTPKAEEMAAVQVGFALIEKEELWFIAQGYNAFCHMQPDSGEITPIVKFDDVSMNAGIYNSFARNGDKYFFCPVRGLHILEYDMQMGTSKTIPIENPLDWGNFAQMVSYKHYVFMIPSRYPAILRYDINTGECKYYRDCLKELMAYRTKDHDEILSAFSVRGQKLLLPAVLTNKILEFDMETAEYQIHTVGKVASDCMYFIADENDDYWLIPWRTTAIRKWNYKTGCCEVYDKYPDDFSCMGDWNTEDTYMFSGAVKRNGAIWLFPLYANMILRVDLATGIIEKVDLNLPFGLYQRKAEFYMQQPNFFNAVPYGENKIIAMSSYDRSLLIIDVQTETFKIAPCRLSEKNMKKLSTPLEDSFGCIGKTALYAMEENTLWRSVANFIGYVVDGKHDKKRQKEAYARIIENIDGTCGEKVHQYIMEQIGK